MIGAQRFGRYHVCRRRALVARSPSLDLAHAEQPIVGWQTMRGGRTSSRQAAIGGRKCLLALLIYTTYLTYLTYLTYVTYLTCTYPSENRVCTKQIPWKDSGAIGDRLSLLLVALAHCSSLLAGVLSSHVKHPPIMLTCFLYSLTLPVRRVWFRHANMWMCRSRGTDRRASESPTGNRRSEDVAHCSFARGSSLWFVARC